MMISIPENVRSNALDVLMAVFSILSINRFEIIFNNFGSPLPPCEIFVVTSFILLRLGYIYSTLSKNVYTLKSILSPFMLSGVIAFSTITSFVKS